MTLWSVQNIFRLEKYGIDINKHRLYVKYVVEPSAVTIYLNSISYITVKNIGVLYYSKTISNLSVLQKGVEDTLETAVNRTVDMSNQALADSGSDLSIPLFVAGFVVGLGLGLNNGRGRKSRLVIEG